MRIWYSYKGVPYKGSCPAFYDLRGVGWYDSLVASLPAIQEDAIRFLDSPGVEKQPYFNTEIIAGNSWEGVSFLFWNEADHEAMKRGEKLFSYFGDIPGLVSLSISLLHPGTHIMPHYGDTDAVHRLHIPVYIPAGLPDCGIKVNGEERAWDNNSILCFCDGHQHEAWNNSGEIRVVIIADVIRKELLNKRDDICYNVRSMLDLQKLYLRSRLALSSPWYIKGVLRHLLKWRLMFRR